MMLYVMDFRPAPSDGGVVVKFQRMRSPMLIFAAMWCVWIRQQPGGALRLSALVWLVWYRMGVTRGGHVDGGVHTCRVRLRRNGRRRVVWMMMMWRPSIASLSL